MIKELANIFKDDKQPESLVMNILTRLTNFGIKKDMSKYYDESNQADIIEDIFDQIILKKFGQEYNKMIKYDMNNDVTNDNYIKIYYSIQLIK